MVAVNKNIKILIGLEAISFILLAFLVRFFPHSDVDIYISKHVQEEINGQRPIEHED